MTTKPEFGRVYKTMDGEEVLFTEDELGKPLLVRCHEPVINGGTITDWGITVTLVDEERTRLNRKGRIVGDLQGAVLDYSCIYGQVTDRLHARDLYRKFKKSIQEARQLR